LARRLQCYIHHYIVLYPQPDRFGDLRVWHSHASGLGMKTASHLFSTLKPRIIIYLIIAVSVVAISAPVIWWITSPINPMLPETAGTVVAREHEVWAKAPPEFSHRMTEYAAHGHYMN